MSNTTVAPKKLSEQAKWIADRNIRIRELYAQMGASETVRRHLGNLFGLIDDDILKILEAK
jgi:hypothetical protein